MIFKEKIIELKNGKSAILKTPEPGDGVKMLDYIKTACGETEFLARYPEEWESVSADSEERWIKGRRESENDLSITCYVDTDVAGNCEINFRNGKKMCHRAVIAIAIVKKYWGLGIGSAMLEELISAAREREGIEIIELEFVEGYDRARVLYEKFGFTVVGERPNAFKLKNGRTVKEIFMQKKL